MAQVNLKEIGERLKRTRKALKLKQDLFAKELEFSKTSISDYETGKKKPPFDLLVSLSRVFNVNLHYILFGEGEMFRGNDEMPRGGVGDAAPFGDLTPGIMKIIETMKVSQYARASIYTMALEFLYKNRELVRYDMREASAGADGTAGNDSHEMETASTITIPEPQNHEDKNEKIKI
jgi:transcriptional regulator with XRE-family HTH domain